MDTEAGGLLSGECGLSRGTKLNEDLHSSLFSGSYDECHEEVIENTGLSIQ